MNRLLNESWIEGLPDSIVENLEELNRYVVQRICERIREIGDIGASDAHRLKSAIEYAGADLGAVEKEISRVMGLNQREVQRLFEEVAAENIDFANTYYAARGMEELKTYRSRASLTAFVEAAKRTAMDGTANLSHTRMIGFRRGARVVSLREYYITAIDRAVTFVQTGAVDYQTAMRSTVRDMARSGLRRVTFDSGYSRRLDSQARMNILEGVRRLNADMMEETGKEFGADGVEISVHGLCAPDHQPIQGRQYSNAEYKRLNERLQRPIGTLNCHHFSTPIIMGVSRPVHSARELEEINARSNAPVEYRGRTMTRYEASQKQRQLETAIRYAKDEWDACAAAGDKIGAAQARKRSAALSSEYKSFCQKAGLTPRPERTRSITGPTVERAPKVLDKTAKSGILNDTGYKGVPITEEAIQRVPQVRPEGWGLAQLERLQEAHRDLLRAVMDNPVGTEAGAVYTPDMRLIERKIGDAAAQQIIMPRCQEPHVFIHNHPSGEIFSHTDILPFAMNENTLAITAVGNRGNVYLLQKTDDYDGFLFLQAYYAALPRLKDAINASDIEKYIAIMKEFLEDAGKYGAKLIKRG